MQGNTDKNISSNGGSKITMPSNAGASGKEDQDGHLKQSHKANDDNDNDHKEDCSTSTLAIARSPRMA